MKDTLIITGFVGAIALIVAVAFSVIKFELRHPCLEYGELRFAYMYRVGEVMVPHYRRDCLRRKGLAN